MPIITDSTTPICEFLFIFYSTKGINQLNVIREVQIKKGHV